MTSFQSNDIQKMTSEDIKQAVRGKYNQVASTLGAEFNFPVGRKFAESVKRTYNVFGDPHKNRFAWLPPDVSPTAKANTLFFAGCTPAYRSQEIARATVSLLKKIGVKFIMYIFYVVFKRLVFVTDTFPCINYNI